MKQETETEMMLSHISVKPLNVYEQVRVRWLSCDDTLPSTSYLYRPGTLARNVARRLRHSRCRR